MRLIDADALKPDVRFYMSSYQFYSQTVINKAPTIEAEPVRHGKWRETHNIFQPLYCDTCRRCATDRTPYCPNCGAEMEGRETFCDGQWIPCRERLPESEELEILCLVTYQDYNVFESKWNCRKIGIMSYLTKHGIWNTKALTNVLAWMPLPELYKEQKNNG